jgi:Spy/CpxP family protein refolding chaperone
MNGGCNHHSERVQSADGIVHPIEHAAPQWGGHPRKRWTMNKIILATATALIATTAAASAASVNDRQEYQAKRIEQGRQSGKITWTEGLKLRAEQKRIANKEAQFKSDGYLTKSERRQLRYMQNDASEHIADEKSDSRKRAWWLPRVGK